MSSGATASRRYRGSTKESTSSKARAIESALMNKARQGKLTGRMKSATLAEFSLRFLDWVDGTRLEAKTKRYYHTRLEVAREDTNLEDAHWSRHDR